MLLLYSISVLYMGLSSKNRNFFLPKQFIFSDEEVSVTTPISKNTMKWDAFIDWKKIAGFYVLYFSSATFYAIPKSDLPVQEILTFENLLRSKIKRTVSIRWTWQIMGLLIFIIILSLGWLFTIFAAHYSRASILGAISGIFNAIVMGAPVVLLAVEFGFFVSGKRSGSRKKVKISSVLLFLTIVGMIVVLLDLYIFASFMY